MRALYAFTLLAAFVLSASSAFAADEVSPKQKEEAYQLLCVPGSETEQNLEESKRKEALDFRAVFQEFLRAPEARIAEFKTYKAFGGNVNGGFFGMITFGLFCATADALHGHISERGCHDERGVAISSNTAVSLCAPLIDLIRDKK